MRGEVARLFSSEVVKLSYRDLAIGREGGAGGSSANVKIKDDYSQYIMFRYSRIYRIYLLRLAGW